jgi:hypothetical protein
MKTTSMVVLTWLTAFCLYGQSQQPVITFISKDGLTNQELYYHQPVIVLTSKDVDTNHVRLATHPDTPYQNLIVPLIGKTSEEIRAIDKLHPRVQILKDGVVVVEAEIGWGFQNRSTNYNALLLGFKKYDQGKLAEKTLRGN